MVKSRYIGDGHPTFNRNPYNWYIKPHYWVYDHPLLDGNNGSLDPSTYEIRQVLIRPGLHAAMMKRYSGASRFENTPGDSTYIFVFMNLFSPVKVPEYGSFRQDLGCAKDQNLGAGAQKMVRCAGKSIPGVPKYI